MNKYTREQEILQSRPPVDVRRRQMMLGAAAMFVVASTQAHASESRKIAALYDEWKHFVAERRAAEAEMSRLMTGLDDQDMSDLSLREIHQAVETPEYRAASERQTNMARKCSECEDRVSLIPAGTINDARKKWEVISGKPAKTAVYRRGSVDSLVADLFRMVEAGNG